MRTYQSIRLNRIRRSPGSRGFAYALSLPIVLALFLAATLLARPAPAGAQSPDGALPQIELSLVTGGLSQPLFVTHAGDGSGRLFVVEREGYVRIFENGVLLQTPFLDITDRVLSDDCGECGLLSIVFPPDYKESGVFYASYSANDNPVPPDDPNELDGVNDSVVARFAVTNDPNVADPDSEERILLVNQPRGNHNGGLILFGPDDHLYFGLGDGGGSDDPDDVARNPDSLLGKMLRLQVTSTGTYTVPADNPFVGQAAYRPEIWALGLRNPWRFSFDRQTGDLYIGDVGQGSFEEVNFQPGGDPGGQDYGWDVMEGFMCNDPDIPGNETCDPTGLTLPVHDYPRGEGWSVTGGYVYRGSSAALQGIYIYGDFGSGRIWGLRNVANAWANDLFVNTDLNISSFGEDETGELYVVDYGGVLYRITTPVPLLERSYVPLFMREENDGRS